VHLVFSTKARTPWLQDFWRERLHAYIAAVVSDCSTKLIIVNSVQDHIHIFMPLPKTMSIAGIVQKIKTGSTNWIHRTVPGTELFQWQRGYAIFSVSPSHKAAVIGYIQGQAEHHKAVTFQDELRRLLQKYNVTFDEAYVWD
jgi:REP element-mobilizing transposase RayT